MPAAEASAEGRGVSTIAEHSQIAIKFASPEYRKSGADIPGRRSHIAYMDDAEEKNGGPNHLRAWMRYKGMTGVQLAEALGGNVTAGMISDLANSKRQLSAKWLRRLAPVLGTTPGHLLDHDPEILPTDILEVWLGATAEQRRQLAALAKVVVETSSATGTDGKASKR